jgi:hypothetical protein
MAVGDLITASRFNLLQNRIAAVLGAGAGQTGYGQGASGYGGAISSEEVTNTPGGNMQVNVTAQSFNNLYKDLIRARIHQIGLSNSEITDEVKNLEFVAGVDIVAEETGIGDNANLKGIADLEALMDRIEGDKFLVDTSQSIVETGAESVRTSQWNGQLIHEVKVSFNNASHRRHFFNSGGELRIELSNIGYTTPKGNDWNVLLARAGTVKFNHDSTTTTDQGTPSAIGNYDLTSSYQLIYTKLSNGGIYPTYNQNLYEIYVKEISDSEIQFKMLLDDLESGAEDDLIEGTLTSKVNHLRAKSSLTGDDLIDFHVEVPLPVYQNITTL